MDDEKIFDIAPGEKYEDNRSRLTIFFQVLGRKFWKLISINLMYILFNLPAIIIAFALAVFAMDFFMPNLVMSNSAEEIIATLFVVSFPLAMFFMAVPVICVGPAQAGLTYLLRCFSYEIPTFNWSDFKDKAKENIKQSLAVTFINLIVLVFLLFDFYLYSRINTGSNIIMSIANGLLIVIFLTFIMMSLYIYPMMVTYELSLKHLYKNALLFSFARFLPNLGILLLVFAIVMAPIIIVQLSGSVIALTIAYAIYMLLGFTLPGYIINFFINPVIDKYLRPDSKPEDKPEEEKPVGE